MSYGRSPPKLQGSCRRPHTRVIPYLGLPKIFQSGNGRDFVNQLVLQLVAEWGADDAFFVNGSPKHSQSQGKYSIEEEICKCRAQAGLDGAKEYPWASWLPRIQFILNNVRSEATQQTPYELVFGHSSHSDLYSGVCVDGNVINEEDLPATTEVVIDDEIAQTASVNDDHEFVGTPDSHLSDSENDPSSPQGDDGSASVSSVKESENVADGNMSSSHEPPRENKSAEDFS
ncbi:uncharacterized protein LOC117517923 [Thalassophryne amazonica]|uniref:uncharacterized protein LOC117517923 n=1 Tax=Thalassophryne amazonica TaxID=390379 RepID=UPI001471EADF|nr:uncharacterized protein LOC117517923 [Thalassophryne amazonica]